MRTKTLLIAAAALAATVIGSEAQTVYSANIVGYVNVICPANTLVLAANPLDNGTNDLNSLVGALPTKSQVQIWNGAGFTAITKGASWTPDVVIPPGGGFFIKSATLQTNTFVGNVACLIGASVTNTLTANTLFLVGSTIPYSGTLNDTNVALNILPAKSQVQEWNGAGFTAITKGATWPSGTVTVAGGFFCKISDYNQLGSNIAAIMRPDMTIKIQST
jgi:hypothetical protein